jgi:predicted transcriptional regulator
MATDQSWAAVERQAERLLRMVRAFAPKAEIEVPTHQVYILGMFWRCVRLFDAALLLLKAELPEEAAILSRSLFEESLRLQQLAADPDSRDALVLGWANESISQKVGLLETAKSIGLDDDIESELAKLAESRKQLQAYQVRRGVKRLQRFRSEREAALRFSRQDDFWTYEWSHESVHGSDAAWMFARRAIASGAAALHAKTSDRAVRGGFTEFAAGSLTEAVKAVSTIFSWPLPDELTQPLEEIRNLLTPTAG